MDRQQYDAWRRIADNDGPDSSPTVTMSRETLKALVDMAGRGLRASELSWVEGERDAFFDGRWTGSAAAVAAWVYEGTS